MKTVVPTADAIVRKARDLSPFWPVGLIGVLILTAAVLMLLMPWLSDRGSPDQDAASTVPEVGFVDLQRALQRTGIRPDGDAPAVDVFLDSPVYYSSVKRTPPPAADERPSIVMQISETTHTGTLPESAPSPVLKIGDTATAKPFYSSVLADTDHHRLTILAYPLETDDARSISLSGVKQVQLLFLGKDGSAGPQNVLTWDLPIHYTPEVSSSEVAVGVRGSSAVVVNGFPSFTLAGILAIMAGMLVALSPCLLGLGVYFASVLAGAAGEGTAPGKTSVAAARRHVLQTALFFSLGYTLVYTAGGAAAGLVGRSLEHLGLFTTWVRPVSESAGAVILLLAVRVAWNGRAPGVCRLPLAPVFGKSHRTGPIGAALMGFTFAGGCLSCFSATVLPALLLYASALGSVAYGALLLMVFSFGISIPAVGLALGVSRSERVMSWLQRNSPRLALASAVVMAAFGLLMVTYTYHFATGLLGKYLDL